MRRRIACLRDSGNLAWSTAAAFISLIAIAPVLAIIVLAPHSSGDSWPHLIANVLPDAMRRTLSLMAGVGVLTLLIGTGTARFVTMYRFPGRSLFQWLLLLPLAIPTYIILYCYLELFVTARCKPRSARYSAGKRQGLLVSRYPHCRRRHLRHEHGAPSLRLSPRGRASLCNRCAWSK
jgi:ABC-type spermidine/putrescine transport system permease subunit II